jgi:hypothetical protein
MSKGIAEVTGEISVLEVGFVVRPGGQQHSVGVVAIVGGELAERVAQGTEESG